MKKTRTMIFLIAIISLIALSLLIAGCSSAVQKQATTQTQGVPGGTPTKVTGSTDIAINSTKPAQVQQQDTAAQVIADAVYTEQTQYFSPGGQNTIEISITVENDTVLAASVVSINADQRSSHYINNVNAALPSLVVGKKIDQLNIPHNVAGSSLTTAAFKAEVESLIARY